MKLRSAIAKLRCDPGVVADRLYLTVRGTHPRQLRWEHDTGAGALRALATLATHATGGIRRENLGHVFVGVAETADARDLAELFTKHGSDKSTVHDYHIAYAGILSGRRNEKLSILEIGIGTDNVLVPSNMGTEGRPGASLRAFRDWAPNAQIFGADIDSRILFSEERIATYYVDQTSTELLASLSERIPNRAFDLIIDDGLHSPWANLNTLNFACSLLAPNGVFVVEDILDQYLSTWEIAAALLKDKYSVRLIACKTEWIFLVQRGGCTEQDDRSQTARLSRSTTLEL